MFSSKKLIAFLTLFATSYGHCATKQILNTKIKQDFEKCILNVHGIARQVPHAYCSFIKLVKQQVDMPDIVLAEGNQKIDSVGIILVGKTGVGKTELAKFFAEITETVFIPVEEDIISPYIGGTAKNIHNEFENARKKARETQKQVVLFFDEIDKLAGYTGSEQRAEHRAGYQQLNQELDRCKKDGDIIVIGATNYIEKCAHEFRNRFEEVSIVVPQSNEERMSILSWHFLRPNLMRAFAPQAAINYYQAVMKQLPEDTQKPFEKLFQLLEKLTEEILTHEENWSIATLKFHSLIKNDIEKLESLFKHVKEHIEAFNRVASKHGSFQELHAKINKIIDLQVQKMTRYLCLANILNENNAKLIAQKTNGWNFRDLEKLASAINNYQDPLTKEAIFTLINDIEKSRSKDKKTEDEYANLKIAGNLAVRFAEVALEAAVRGTVQKGLDLYFDKDNKNKEK